jgi:drug/metabolite transporter (DMT)-like permease
MTTVYSGLALIAFASNSIICRLALTSGSIDPTGFSTIRLLSGVLALTLISSVVKDEKTVNDSGNWLSACTLFLYIITFSFAYVSLSACTGVLILFGAVQVTMILTGLVQGERPKKLELTGLSVALFGLIYLMLPGWEAPSLRGVILMTVAGVSWGIYSLQGKNDGNPVAVTSGNFTRAIPFAFITCIVYLANLNATFSGMALAFTSGALTSGIGYAVWYAALRGLTVTQAASIQLLVPIIATIGGVIFLSEVISLRLIVSSVLILGGVGSSFMARSHQ